MKDISHIYKIIILVLSIWTFADVHCNEIPSRDCEKVYNNGLIYMAIDYRLSLVRIFESDSESPHPVIKKHIPRGSFNLKHIHDDFYALTCKDLPGEDCVDNMLISHISSSSCDVKVRFRLGDSKEMYEVTAKSIETDSMYSIVYPIEEEMKLPIDSCGYRFSIKCLEEESPTVAGLSYGFSPTIKFLDLKESSREFFSKAGEITLSLPQFNDDVFNFWCINGETIQIHNQIFNEKIIWHGKEFKPYNRIPDIFIF